MSEKRQPSWDEFLTRRYGHKALFKYSEVREIFGCCRHTVNTLVARRKLDIRHVGKSPRVTRLSLLKYLNRKPVRKRRKKRA